MLADSPRNSVTQNGREIPKEVLFRLSSDASNDAKQDPIKKNRYWFKYPEEWSNRRLKDKVLGIRSMYLLEDWFDIQFLMTIRLIPVQGVVLPIPDIYTFVITNCFVGRNQSLGDVCMYFNQLIHEYLDTYGIVTISNVFEVIYNLKIDFCRYEYVSISDGVSKCYIQWNQIFGLKDGQPVRFQYSFASPNDDAEQFFGKEIFRNPDEDLEWHDNIETEIWDRKPLYVLSSIATSSNKSSYLGHTGNREYVPIKYYRLDSDDRQFWVDFYSTRDHSIPVNDLTRWSDYHIEAIFLFSTSAMI